MTACSQPHHYGSQIFVRLSHTHAPSPAPFHSEDAAHTRPPALRCTPALRHSRVTMMRFSSLAKVRCCDASCPFVPPATAAPHPQSLHSSLSHFKFHRSPRVFVCTPSARASVAVVTEQPRQSHDIAHYTVHAMLSDVLSRTLGEGLESWLMCTNPHSLDLGIHATECAISLCPFAHRPRAPQDASRAQWQRGATSKWGHQTRFSVSQTRGGYVS